MLPHAAGRNPGNHTAAVGRAVRKVDPDGWKNRREQKLRDVAMIRLSHGDGVADILLRNLDSLQSEVLWTAADTWARQQKAAGDQRTLDALRVHAILHWATCFMTGTPITHRHRRHRHARAARPRPTRRRCVTGSRSRST